MLTQFKLKLLLVWFACLLSAVSFASPDQLTYREAKKIARQIWQDHRVSFYCECKFDKNLNVNHQSCGYQPEDLKRAKRIEWEHLLPVSWFAHHRPCWRQPLCRNKNNKPFSGRNCCERQDPQFRKMYTDLHNLVPAVGEVNKARAHFRFAEFNYKNKELYNGCNFKIDEEKRRVEPKDTLKGLIARAHLYMAWQYSFKLSKQQRKLFTKWHKTYPPSEWEKTWNNRVQMIQKTDNLYISQYPFDKGL